MIWFYSIKGTIKFWKDQIVISGFLFSIFLLIKGLWKKEIHFFLLKQWEATERAQILYLLMNRLSLFRKIWELIRSKPIPYQLLCYINVLAGVISFKKFHLISMRIREKIVASLKNCQYSFFLKQYTFKMFTSDSLKIKNYVAEFFLNSVKFQLKSVYICLVLFFSIIRVFQV